jgi:hypothetical protein
MELQPRAPPGTPDVSHNRTPTAHQLLCGRICSAPPSQPGHSVQQRQAGAPSKAAIQLQRTLAPMALKRAVICAGEPVNTECGAARAAAAATERQAVLLGVEPEPSVAHCVGLPVSVLGVRVRLHPQRVVKQQLPCGHQQSSNPACPCLSRTHKSKTQQAPHGPRPFSRAVIILRSTRRSTL